MSIGKLWAALGPQRYNLHPIFRYVLTESSSLLKYGNPYVYEIPVQSQSDKKKNHQLTKVYCNVKSMRLFAQFFAYAYKRNSTLYLNNSHDLKPHSWFYDKRY